MNTLSLLDGRKIDRLGLRHEGANGRCPVEKMGGTLSDDRWVYLLERRCMYWLSNYRHKIETSKKSCPVHCPMTGNGESRESRENKLLFNRLSRDVHPPGFQWL